MRAINGSEPYFFLERRSKVDGEAVAKGRSEHHKHARSGVRTITDGRSADQCDANKADDKAKQ